jgi:hypothetical protein
MYNKNSLQLKNCVIYKIVLHDKKFFEYHFLQIKHQMLYLCHTYFTVLYEMHSGIFLQQLMKVKGNKYSEHSN